MHHSGGNYALYLEILGTFHADVTARMSVIKDYASLADIKPYVICVHAIKGAAANIGATTLSQAAFELEKASSRGDMDYLSQHNKAFIYALEKLLVKINGTLSAHYEQTKSEVSEVSCKDLLTRLQQGLQSMDFDAINSSMDELQQIIRADHTHEELNDIYKHVLTGEHKQALDIIEGLV
jgi:HPt (histidine-containing phosphotransfer) domain-containing protein